MMYSNLIITLMAITLLCTVVQSSVHMVRFRRSNSFSSVEDALVYLGPNPEIHNTQYLAQCAVQCVTNSSQVFLYHHCTSLCILSSTEFHNSSASTGSSAQRNREQYKLYQIYDNEEDKDALECPDGIVSLGMESRDIPDSAITVSDEFIGGRLTKDNSRIGAKGGWCTPKVQGSTNHTHWIAVALNGTAIIYQVATAGCSSCQLYWVEQYSVQYSDDGLNWTTYQTNGIKKIFNGNKQAQSAGTVYQNFTPPIVAAHFKLYTEKLSLVDFRGELSAIGGLRMELYGCYL